MWMMAVLPTNVDPSKTPLFLNPSGAPPNFINPPDLKGAQLISGVVLITTATVFVVCRLWTNYKLSGKLAFDDFLCVCALILGIGYWTLVHEECSLGFSRHGWDTPVSIFTTTLIKVNVATQIISGPAMWAAKSTILVLYIRLFGKIAWLRYTCYVWIMIMALVYSVSAIAVMIYVFPRRGQTWDDSVYQGSLEKLWMLPTVGAFSCVADLVILILPFRVLYHLHMDKSKKIRLGFMFAMGVVLVVLSVAALYLRVLIFHGIDPLWDGMRLSIIAAAEMFGTVIISCAPALSAFWFKIFTASTIWNEIKSTSSSLRMSLSSRTVDFEPLSSSKTRSIARSLHDDQATGIMKTTEYKVSEVDLPIHHVRGNWTGYSAVVSGGISSKQLLTSSGE